MNSSSRPPKIAYVSVSNFEKKKNAFRNPAETWPTAHPSSTCFFLGVSKKICWTSWCNPLGQSTGSHRLHREASRSFEASFRMSTLSRHLSHSSSTNCWILSNFRSCQRGWSWSHQPISAISHESHTRKVTLDRIVSPTPHDPTNRRTCFPRFPSIIPVSREELGSQMSPAGDHENTMFFQLLVIRIYL